MYGEQIADVISYSFIGNSVVVGSWLLWDKCKPVIFFVIDVIEMSFRAFADGIVYMSNFESLESENEDSIKHEDDKYEVYI